VRLTHTQPAQTFQHQYDHAMRVFLAGATGAIGSQLVPQLIAAGHEVAGLTRRPYKAASLADAGAHAVVCDLYDPALAQHVADFAPDVVIHQVTDLPATQALIPLKVIALNKARRRGTDILIAAAKQAGASTFLAQSIAFTVPGIVRGAVDHLESQTLAYPGIVVRYGVFYGPGTWSADRPRALKAINVVDAAARTATLLQATPGTYELVDHESERA
jgi:nucleoside-diphosphate-sugar epimerase